MNARGWDRYDNSRPYPDYPGGLVVRAAFGRSAGARVCARCGAESCVAWGPEYQLLACPTEWIDGQSATAPIPPAGHRPPAAQAGATVESADGGSADGWPAPELVGQPARRWWSDARWFGWRPSRTTPHEAEPNSSSAGPRRNDVNSRGVHVGQIREPLVDRWNRV